MYLHEAMKEPDWNDFMTAMVKEATYQMDNGNFSIIPKSQVTTGATILPAVWKTKWKQEIKTMATKKWKSRLNIYG